MLVSTAEWEKAVNRMWDAGMLVFPASVVAVCGAFAVAKPDGRLRAICDARPANWEFAEPDHVALPSPDLIARMRSPSPAPIYVARTDAADYYHSFKTPSWMWPYFGLPPVRFGALPAAARAAASAAGGRQFHDGERVHPAMCTLPMGYNHAVLLAQEAHLQLLDSIPDLFSRADRLGDPLCTDFTLRPGRVLHVACIDDVLQFGLDPAEMGRRQQAYLAAGRARGLTYKSEKLVRPTADGAPVLGMELDGRAGTLRYKPEKAAQLMRATRAAVAAGEMKAVDLQSLVGRWVWAMLPFRPSLTLFSAVFALVQRFPKGSVKLWPSVRRELLAAAAVAPLIEADLRAPLWPRAMASDASSTGMGVVSVDTAALPGSAPPGTTVPGVSGVVEELPPAAAVTTIVSCRWRWAEHINALEMRAAHLALRWVMRHALPGGVRVPLWVDSTVVCGILRRGRSSSAALNRLTRALAADLLFCGVSIEADWVKSSANPADAPSRA